MADFLREMDPAHRAFLAIFLAVAIKGFLAVQWGRYKDRIASRPIPLKMRRGVLIPWGPVERIQRIGNGATMGWVAYMGALLVLLAWHKLVHPIIP